jgi:glycosyltransferase involved in cell wall biosynthesis
VSRRWVLVSGDFTTLGGMDRANHALARYLAANGRDVHLVAHRVAPELAALPGVTVHRVPRPGGAHLAGAPLLARRAARVVADAGPGASVLVNGGNTGLRAASWIHYLHAAYTPRAAGSLRTRVSSRIAPAAYRRAERAAIDRAPLLICNSHRTADDIRRAYGRTAGVVVSYYGSDAEVFAPVTPDARAAARAALPVGAGRHVAAFVGALGDRRKGFDVLFEGWRALLADAAWDVDLVVAGSGGEAEAWRDRTAGSPLAGRVHFLGFRRDVAEVLAAADVLVHPARYEAYGLGVHEALCREVPAIVAANAGIAERYPADLAPLLIPEQASPAELAGVLRAWRADAAGWRERIRPLAASLRQRTWDEMSADIAAQVEAVA